MKMKVTDMLLQIMRRWSRNTDTHFTVEFLSHRTQLSCQQVREGLRYLLAEGIVQETPRKSFKVVG